MILYAFDDKQQLQHYGWYIGTISGTNLGVRDLKQTPRAKCNVSYRKKAMKGRELPKYPKFPHPQTGLIPVGNADRALRGGGVKVAGFLIASAVSNACVCSEVCVNTHEFHQVFWIRLRIVECYV